MVACARCGADNPTASRFCSNCGAELQQGPREERKVISVLFVDLVGFTASSDRADPEDVRDLLQLYHRRVREQVERFGGTVEKFIGDAVMAVFGAPVAHTDDPERAVRAGLRALQTVEELGRSQLGARAAVNTGEAVVSIGGGHERGEPLALGDVVNTASRLQTAAPPGRLVVGEETFRATRDAIRYEELAPVQAKGKRDELSLWVAIEPIARPAERRMRATPMVGRDRELGLLGSVWERTLGERSVHLVTMLGPAGIGKSRLTRELAGRVEAAGGRVVRGRCLPYDTRDVFGAFAEQVKDVAGIFEQDSPETAREKLAGALAALLPESERDEITRYLSLMLGLGLDAPTDQPELLPFAARRFIERLAAEQPILLVFEDVHWADTGQLDLIEYVASHAKGSPVVLLALARPELLEERPAWGSGLYAQTRLALEPLAEDDARLVVAHLIEGAKTAPDVARLVEVAEGNPLFLEELTAAVIEGAEVAGQLPTSVRAAIAARIDALTPEDRRSLLAASVVGRVFWRGALRALGMGDDLDRVLDGLEAKELIRREPASRVQGDVEFSFRHILIRDVCYATLPRAERRAAHEAVARYVEEVAGEHDRELAWLLAHHWQEAGDEARAVAYLLLAAERAEEALAQTQAMDLFDRALALARDDETKARVKLLRALALVRLEDYDAAVIELEGLLDDLEGMDRLEGLLGLARSYHWTERTAQVLDSSREALELAERLGSDELVGPAMARQSQGLAMRGAPGDLDRAMELGEEALRRWVPGSKADDLADHEHLLANQYYWTGNYARAHELARAAFDGAVDPSSAEALLRGGALEGLVLAGVGRYEEALARFDAVIALGRDLGRPVRVLLNYSTTAYRELFDFDEARRRSEESMTQKGRNPSFHMPWMNAIADLIHTDVLAGELDAAEARWNGIYEEVLSTPAWERWFLGGKLTALRAEIALEREGPEEAAEWATRAIDMALPVGRVKYESVARGVLGRALLSMGRRDDALRELRAAVALADGLGNPTGRWRSKAELARALTATGVDEEAASVLADAAGIIRATASNLSPGRAARFTAAPPVAEVLRDAG